MRLEFQFILNTNLGQMWQREQFWFQFFSCAIQVLLILFCVFHGVLLPYQKSISFEQDVSYHLQQIFGFLLCLKLQSPAQCSKENAFLFSPANCFSSAPSSPLTTLAIFSSFLRFSTESVLWFASLWQFSLVSWIWAQILGQIVQ